MQCVDDREDEERLSGRSVVQGVDDREDEEIRIKEDEGSEGFEPPTTLV